MPREVPGDSSVAEFIPIPNHKVVCPQMAPPGWVYGGFDQGFYLFQKGDYRSGFALMECLEIDLTSQNLALMARLGVTRDRAHVAH